MMKTSAGGGSRMRTTSNMEAESLKNEARAIT